MTANSRYTGTTRDTASPASAMRGATAATMVASTSAVAGTGNSPTTLAAPRQAADRAAAHCTPVAAANGRAISQTKACTNGPGRISAAASLPSMTFRQQHLPAQQHRSGRQQGPGVGAAQLRERHDIIDAGREQHQQDRQADHGVGRQQRGQAPDQGRHEHEVHAQQHPQEPHAGQRGAPASQRHLHEGRQQHAGQHEIERGLAHLQAGPVPGQHGAQRHRREIDTDLPSFERRLQALHDAFHRYVPSCLIADGAGARGGPVSRSRRRRGRGRAAWPRTARCRRAA